jgi:hypothetical protein
VPSSWLPEYAVEPPQRLKESCEHVSDAIDPKQKRVTPGCSEEVIGMQCLETRCN